MELARPQGYNRLRLLDFHFKEGPMSIDRTLTGLVAFAGGMLAGILLAPQSGADTRAKLSEEGKVQLKRMEDQLAALEQKLSEVGDQVVATSQEVGGKVRESTVGQVLPEVPDAEAFKVDDKEVASDLRHLPRK
jgi:gas vesicle protein